MTNTIFWVVMVVIIVVSCIITAMRMTKDMRYDYNSWPIGMVFGLLGGVIGLGIDAVICALFFLTGLAKTLGITWIA